MYKQQLSFAIAAVILLIAFVTVALHTGSETVQAQNATKNATAAGANATKNATAGSGGTSSSAGGGGGY
jgi:hypothetical protein